LPEAIAIDARLGGNEIFVGAAAARRRRGAADERFALLVDHRGQDTSTRSTPATGCDGRGHVGRDPVPQGHPRS
jgi:hypothetical protein